MYSEPGFWQESWRGDVLERGLAASDGLALIWVETEEVLGFVCAHDLGLGRSFEKKLTGVKGD